MEYSPSNPSEVLNRFLCPVCREVVSRPKMTPCEHVFCQKCLKLWIENSPSCPLCRHPLEIDDARAPPRRYQMELSRLKVRCSFNVKGCSEETELRHLRKHERVCKFRGPRCSSVTCKRPLQSKNGLEGPVVKMSKFCCKGCLEEHVIRNYVRSIKTMKSWLKLGIHYAICLDHEMEKNFFGRFSETIVKKLQDIEIKVTNRINSLFPVRETEDEMNRRWGVLVQRLLDSASSQAANVFPASEIRLEANSANEGNVKLIMIYYTPRFREEEDTPGQTENDRETAEV